MIRDRNYDFSFSGLKTALLYSLAADKDWRERRAEYAAEFQQAAVDVLVHKTVKAAGLFNCGRQSGIKAAARGRGQKKSGRRQLNNS